MKEKDIDKKSATKTDWERLRAAKDADINFGDQPELGEDFWQEAQVAFPPKKIHISMRVDEDIVEFFKAQGPGYQSKMNAVLKAYVNSQSRRES